MPATFKRLRKHLATLPHTVAASVAGRAAPALTGLSQKAYDGNRDVYGQARPKSEVDGSDLTLRRSGKTEETLKFVAVGTIVRCALGTPWAKYLVGKYRILPNGPLPQVWRAKLGELVRDTRVPP